MNRYPLWKNVLVIVIMAAGILVALPNLFGEEPALEVSLERGAKLGRPRTLHLHREAVAKLMRSGMSGRKIAAKLEIPEGSVFSVMRSVAEAA